MYNVVLKLKKERLLESTHPKFKLRVGNSVCRHQYNLLRQYNFHKRKYIVEKVTMKRSHVVYVELSI